MGRRKNHPATKSQTLPSSPTHNSSSDFEFTVAITPPGGAYSSSSSAGVLCPADELFYKGQLLPLQISPRRSMLRTLLLASSSISSSDTITTASRDSTGSSSNESRPSFSAADLLLLPQYGDCSRPSTATEDTDFAPTHHHRRYSAARKTSKYINFSLSRFSSVFRKSRHADPAHAPGSVPGPSPSPSTVKRLSKTAKEVIGKYLKKVKPLYEKLSQSQKPSQQRKTRTLDPNYLKESDPHSFSGNLWYPRRRRRRSYVSSCPSSMRSSPSHSGMLCRSGFTPQAMYKTAATPEMSSMEELQNAIQGAIAHCKNSMLQNSSTAVE